MLGISYKIKSIVKRIFESVKHFHYNLCRQLKGGGTEINMKYIYAKKILNKNDTLEWFGADYCINLYRGCNHGCIYCDSRSSCYQDFEFDVIKPKKNALELLKKELMTKKKLGIIDTGAMGDPYNPLEEELLLTRNFLFLIKQFGFGVSITTKSTLIERDIDILKQITDIAPVICEMTITASSDALSKIIEPNVACSSQRFKTIKHLVSNGIYAGIVLMPVLPFIEDTQENIVSIVNQASSAGARFIYPYFGVTLRHNQREYFLKKLDLVFPNKRLSDKYKEYYDEKYECISCYEVELRRVFERECDKRGILYKMEDIINEYKKKHTYKQLSLFDM